MLRDLFSLFPAHAGVILNLPMPRRKRKAFPRTCGGDPITTKQIYELGNFSPHMRG